MMEKSIKISLQGDSGGPLIVTRGTAPELVGKTFCNRDKVSTVYETRLRIHNL